MTAPADYRVAFGAQSPEPLDARAADALAAALEAMPGIGAVHAVSCDDAGRRVTAAFLISVRLGMADAARDGSRLAKEALKVAGIGHTQLTELSVSLSPARGTGGD